MRTGRIRPAVERDLLAQQASEHVSDRRRRDRFVGVHGTSGLRVGAGEIDLGFIAANSNSDGDAHRSRRDTVAVEPILDRYSPSGIRWSAAASSIRYTRTARSSYDGGGVYRNGRRAQAAVSARVPATSTARVDRPRARWVSVRWPATARASRDSCGPAGSAARGECGFLPDKSREPRASTRGSCRRRRRDAPDWPRRNAACARG